MKTVVAWMLFAGVAQFSIPDPGPLPPETTVPTTPHHLSRSETKDFLDLHSQQPDVRQFLHDPSSTPWGIVVGDYGRDFLLFADARGSVHVVEITGQPAVDEIRKAPYESPRFDVIGL